MAAVNVARTLIKPIANKNRFHLLFCHGLGSAKRDLIASKIQQWANQREVAVHDLTYRNYGKEDHVWDINDWKRDVLEELEGIQKKSKLSAGQSDLNDNAADCNTVIVCNSAASQAVIRAIISTGNEASASFTGSGSLAGILMISPGIGMNVREYMERLMPGSMEALKAGKILNHPSADPSVKIKVNFECLQDFVNNCPTRNASIRFPITCPIRIVHGIYDKLVPYHNSVDFLDRVEAKDKALYLINDGHFIRDQQIINYALDSLWSTLNNKKV